CSMPLLGSPHGALPRTTRQFLLGISQHPRRVGTGPALTRHAPAPRSTARQTSARLQSARLETPGQRARTGPRKLVGVSRPSAAPGLLGTTDRTPRRAAAPTPCPPRPATRSGAHQTSTGG